MIAHTRGPVVPVPTYGNIIQCPIAEFNGRYKILCNPAEDMPMARTARLVKLSRQDQKELQAIASKKTSEARFVQCAKIVLLCDKSGHG